MDLHKATGFLKQAYYQGHGRYVNQIARLTIKFSKSGGSSREVRKFIETRLVDVARSNPGCAIYVKPRIFKAPVVSAEYLNGNKQYVNLYQMSAVQVEAWLEWFLNRSGQDLYKLNRPTASSRPTIQGIWTPFTFRDPETNVIKFPCEERGKHMSVHPSATEQLEKLANESNSYQSQQ